MKPGRYKMVILLLVALILSSGCACRLPKSDAAYQVSTLDALLEGVYDGSATFGELKKHGDFGIGTFDALDGEMIAVDGAFYQVKADGSVLTVGDEAKTPFSMVMFFTPKKILSLSGIKDMDTLMRNLDNGLQTKNAFYAVRIDGTFPYIRTRSVPAQHKPYPGLAEVVRKQAVFEFRNISGTIVGFRAPAYARGINMPGYHFHFISSDRKKGGHLLGCTIDKAALAIKDAYEFQLSIPSEGEFLRSDLGRDRARELENAER